MGSVLQITTQAWRAFLFAITLYIVGMSKNRWFALGAGVVLILIVGFFLAQGVFRTPKTAPDGRIPFGFFDASDSFADSLTAKNQLAAVGSVSARKVPPESLTAAKDNLGDALVNIICAAKNGGVRSISGSGVLISRDGVVITNSHIAQLFLLSDYPTKGNVVCVVRTGSPARTAYYAELAYLSASWMETHPDSLVATNPKGSGENDFALLQVTRSATDAPLPEAFPFVSLATGAPALQESVAIGSYGAESLTSEQIRTALIPTLVLGVVQDVYTFERTTVDLLSLGGSAAAQHGSSGGGIVNEKGSLVAVITTSSTAGTFASRDLRAITADHIRRSFSKDIGVELDAYLETHTRTAIVSAFAQKQEILRAALTTTLALSTAR